MLPGSPALRTHAPVPNHAEKAGRPARPTGADRRIDVLSCDVADLTVLASSRDEPAYRGQQLARWLFREATDDITTMTDLPARFRTRLGEAVRIGGAEVIDSISTPDGETEKLLLRNPDGATIETVCMRQSGSSGIRTTLCLSSQVGCAVGCPFCATGQAGWFRNLTTGEIVEQVLIWTRRLRPRGIRVDNVVYMGMGEPLGNYDAVWKSIRILNDPRAYGLGARHMTVSTSGIAPRIERMATEGVQVNLAVSLHAADDTLRDELVPLNRQYPLARLMEACRTYLAATNRRISLEYVLLRDVNDSPAQARRLADLIEGLLCHVNVIPLNPEPTSRYTPPTVGAIDAFVGVLRDRRIQVTVRRERGQEIAAACGQLARGYRQRRPS